MTFADHVCDLTEWVIRYSYVILIISMAVMICLAYMAGYWDGYHAGAIHYIDLASLPNGTTYLAPGKYAVGGMP